MALRAEATSPDRLNVPALRSYNCMRLPDENDIPIELRLSAAINMILCDFKVRDQLSDAPGLPWKIANQMFAARFGAAAMMLSKFDFPLHETFEWLSVQALREKEARFSSGEVSPLLSNAAMALDIDRMSWLGEPTAVVTGLFFRHAALACRIAARTADLLYQLGSSFGQLVYVLDALEDFEKDLRRGEFNAIRSCSPGSSRLFNSPNSLDSSRFIARAAISDATLDAALNLIRSRRQDIEKCIEALPIDESTQQLFRERFLSSTEKRLSRLAGKKHRKFHRNHRSEVCKAASPQAVTAPGRGRSLSLPARIHSALSFAQELSCSNAEIERAPHLVQRAWRFFQRHLCFIYCFVFAIVFPHGKPLAATPADCIELPFNLIFLGGTARSTFVWIREMFKPPSLALAGTGGASFASTSGPMVSHSIDQFLSLSARQRRRRYSQETDERPAEENWNCCDCCDGCSECGDCCDGCSGCGDCGGGHNACCDCDCGSSHCGGCDCSGCDCGSCDCHCH